MWKTALPPTLSENVFCARRSAVLRKAFVVREWAGTFWRNLGLSSGGTKRSRVGGLLVSVMLSSLYVFARFLCLYAFIYIFHVDVYADINICRVPSQEVTESRFCQNLTHIGKINISRVPSQEAIEHWFCQDLTYISKINMFRVPSQEVKESIFCQIPTHISKIIIFRVPSQEVIEHWFCQDLTYISKNNISEFQVKK